MKQQRSDSSFLDKPESSPDKEMRHKWYRSRTSSTYTGEVARWHFKSHQDTPESSLVGTFLLEIGFYKEDGKYEKPYHRESDEEIDVGNFCIGGIRRTAKSGQWVAFHPDIPHSVERLGSGSRAVIGFKIFSVEDIKGSFGAVLERQYSMRANPRNLVGSDAVLPSAAKQLPGMRGVEIVLVIIYEKKTTSSREREYDDKGAESNVEATAWHPFTAFHVTSLSATPCNQRPT
ncbi:hypothetical protein AAF712_015599 [Marasmius tenuissimus]|uniref:Prolyl 4-hydroxylase alpha subunit Fe(2+) 2OG dioxygenase domain-containing protein n=1 Tax=Marasmius tenuissimus TaxID=585030 RepID=A0ABR2Z7U6_9AGAR